MPRRKIRVSTARVFARQTAATKIFKLTSAAYIFILTSGRVHANIYNVATGLCCDWVWRSLVACLNGVQEAGGSNPLTQTMRKALENVVFSRAFCCSLFFTIPFRIGGLPSLSAIANRMPARQGAEACAQSSSCRLHLWQHLWQHSTGKPQLSKHGSQYQSLNSSISSQPKDQFTLCSLSIFDPQ